MSPERFICEPYSSNTDIWSLGLSLLECAWGVFPYPHPGSNESHQLGFWEMKEYIISRPAPPAPPNFSVEG
jgi:serine/threonine protein kinase